MKKNILLILFLSIIENIFSADIPVVFIHRGNSFYLKDSFWQARQYNSRVIVIGDHENDNYSNVDHYLMDQYFSEAQKFSTIYQHQSSNPYDYELFCFQRWFILKEFMEDKKIDICFYCDSDIMLYSDVGEDYQNYDQFDLSLVRCYAYSSGHTSYFSLSSIQRLCQFIVDFYLNFDQKRNIYYLISDMIVLHEYANHFKNVGWLNDIIDNCCYDDNISGNGDLYVMKNGMKEVSWRQKRPYGYHKILNKYIQFKSLHFQGDKKKFMQLYRRKNFSLLSRR